MASHIYYTVISTGTWGVVEWVMADEGRVVVAAIYTRHNPDEVRPLCHRGMWETKELYGDRGCKHPSSWSVSSPSRR